MNLIQEREAEVEFYTSLRDVERWLEIELDDYDWHLSDLQGGWSDEDPIWITGDILKQKITTYNYQFIWAVVSAFPSGTPLTLSSKPYADGNPDFWNGKPNKQLPEALFEIVCWDGSATLFIGLPEELAQRLLINAPGIKDLDKHNSGQTIK